MEKKNVEKVNSYKVGSTEQVCFYDARRDCEKVIPDLGVDINDMLQTGIVKNSAETLDNNGIDNPSEIIGRISSVFDALDAARIVKKYGKKSPAKAAAEVANLTDTNNND